MKIECLFSKISKAVNQVERGVGKNLTLPILNSILIITSGKVVKLRSTNLSLGVEIEVPAKIETEGVVAVPGNILTNTLNSFRGEDKVFLELVGQNLLVRTKNNEILIKSFPHDDFPTIPIVSGKSWEIPSEKFIDGLRSVFYSGAISDIKPEISSVYIYPSDDRIIFVATDSFRLAEKKIIIKKSIDLPSIIIPLKNITEIIKLLSDNKEILKITSSKNQISFSSPGFYLTSRIIDGVFPDYTQIIPKEFKTEAIVLKQDLLDALKLANVFSDKFNQIKLNLKPKEKVFEISSQNNDIGENKTKITTTTTGEDITLNFNQKYLIDCFQSIPEDSIILRFNEANKPVIISGGGNNSFLYLIMPMNR
ncbi:MAG TPA: DNA polymerase III subunit beta [Candidatus Paceibacterota bacterium]|nr:DNA polymerase III subunit beta [Candidatus Paceibacterota bacterium]